MCALTLAARVPGPGRGPRDPGVAAPALHGPRRVRLGPDTWHTWPGDACSSGCLMVAGLQSTERSRATMAPPFVEPMTACESPEHADQIVYPWM